MKSYVIDLTQDPYDRWRHIDPRPIRALVKSAQKTLGNYPFYVPITALIKVPSEFKEEIRGLADHADVNEEWLRFLNLSYDLSSCGLYLPHLFGCSAYVCSDTLPVLARTLDWSFPAGIAKYTTKFTLLGGTGRKVYSLGFPGFAGCVTGMNDAGVALSLNQAFHIRMPRRAAPVPWLIRDVLRTTGTYAQALRKITTTPAMSSAFYMLAAKEGVARIESTGAEDLITEGPGPIFQTNHFSDDDPLQYEFAQGDTFHRLDVMQRRYAITPRRVFTGYPLTNADTVYAAELSPFSGEIAFQCPQGTSPAWQVWHTKQRP